MKVSFGLLLASFALLCKGNNALRFSNHFTTDLGEKVLMRTENGVEVFTSTGEKNCKRVRNGRVKYDNGKQFTVTECLGNGAFGEVWKGMDSTGKTFAIKVQTPKAESVPSIQEEERKVLVIRDNNLKGVMRAEAAGPCNWEGPGGLTQRGRCMTLEMIKGGELTDLIENYDVRGMKMPLKVVLEITRDVAAALDRISKIQPRGFVQSDLKPPNIMLEMPDGCNPKPHPKTIGEGCIPKPVIIDFGVASHVGSGVRGGTPGYLAPEAALGFVGGKAPVTGKSDVFSLGITMYVMLNGNKAGEGHVSKYCRTNNAAMTSEACMSPTKWPGAPADRDVKNLLAKMTAWSPDNRLSASSVVAEIDRILAAKFAPAPAAPVAPVPIAAPAKPAVDPALEALRRAEAQRRAFEEQEAQRRALERQEAQRRALEQQEAQRRALEQQEAQRRALEQQEAQRLAERALAEKEARRAANLREIAAAAVAKEAAEKKRPAPIAAAAKPKPAKAKPVVDAETQAAKEAKRSARHAAAVKAAHGADVKALLAQYDRLLDERAELQATKQKLLLKRLLTPEQAEELAQTNKALEGHGENMKAIKEVKRLAALAGCIIEQDGHCRGK